MGKIYHFMAVLSRHGVKELAAIAGPVYRSRALSGLIKKKARLKGELFADSVVHRLLRGSGYSFFQFSGRRDRTALPARHISDSRISFNSTPSFSW